MTTTGGSNQSRRGRPFAERHLPFEERSTTDVWPEGARIAVIIELTPEEWNWGAHEPLGVHGAVPLPDAPTPSLSTQSAVEYGFNIGLPRLWEIIEERELSVTAPTTGNAARRYPEVIREFHKRGHEIIAHGYSEGTPPPILTREEQLEDVHETVDAVAGVTGEHPGGWLSPGLLCTEETVELLAEQGFRYHCDLQSDELPFFIDIGGTTMVELPYRIVGGATDLALFANRTARYTTDEALTYYKTVFDAYYREGRRRPQLFYYGIHPYVSGRPDSSEVVASFLDYVVDHEEVWIGTAGEVAEWWSDRFDDRG